MSEILDNLKYVTSHEWIRVEKDNTVVVGITDHAQEALGDLVYVELPEVGAELSVGDECGVVESVKAASDIYSPLSGKVVAVNEELTETPELVNNSPYQDGWILKLELSNDAELADLLDASGYAKCLEDEA
ncbi:glycine cleavage system protein GcvH [Candidatus Albibeggiatoa sp. nov. NOAA]|uniref:glycine cleavage system protein GcvH n=1 Tax=Candidatus Albibeggiatoa sp. nov. NOAA TaxID=3162724 RepID=UPI003301EDAB|nr:glycine cleavage system protein GcvH [Thiotrichaceae bacterium]